MSDLESTNICYTFERRPLCGLGDKKFGVTAMQPFTILCAVRHLWFDQKYILTTLRPSNTPTS